MRGRPTHPTVVAYLALFVALGGTAYAVGAGTIGSRELRDDDVRGQDIRNGTVRDRDVNQRSLAYAKPYLATHADDNGDPGGVAPAVIVQCRTGDVVIGGGPYGGGEAGRFGSLRRSTPVRAPIRRGILISRGATPNGWYVEYTGEPDLGPPTGMAAGYAVCLPVGGR